MSIRQTTAVVGLLSVLAAAPAHAQSAGIETRVVAGVTFQGGIFGDDAPRDSSRVGLTIGGQVRWRPDRGTGAVLDMAFQPLATKNPHFDERLHVLSLHVAPEIGGTFYVRPGGGIALHFWSGQAAESSLQIVPSVGLAIGRHIDSGARMRIHPEVAARTSIEHGALAWTFAAQVPMAWDRQ